MPETGSLLGAITHILSGCTIVQKECRAGAGLVGCCSAQHPGLIREQGRFGITMQAL